MGAKTVGPPAHNGGMAPNPFRRRRARAAGSPSAEQRTERVPRPDPSTTPIASDPTLREPAPDPSSGPRKLTVTRVAVHRTRELTGRAVGLFRRAATADGADGSGLTALTYATMFTYALDAAVAVALANTLFFAAATAESTANVALYLAITVAPFALVAPVIGPMLDRLQRGRRIAMAVSCAGRAVLAVVLVFHLDTWVLYPAALGILVLSKSFLVLKAAVTPRVLPSSITLATTNSRLTTFGMAAGGVAGAVAAGAAWAFGSPGALWWTAALGVAGAVLCLRIPRWVESTAGEVPAAVPAARPGARRGKVPATRSVLVALWGTGAVRVLTGFLTLFVAFVVKAGTEQAGGDPTRQVLVIGVVGAAAGAGLFLGNAIGARSRFDRVEPVVLTAAGAAVLAAAGAALLPGVPAAVVVALIASTASALAKVCLDAVIQRDLPEHARASAFGRSETVLQLAWVLGGAIGVLAPHDTFRTGFLIAAGVIAVFALQSVMVRRGGTLVPGLGARTAPQPTAAMH
ncbi:MFS transporter [Pseudonocardia saturnea]|uniref:MFS transporter n=1 Tax=Pseudonocardia saturnea TaxID=33909 RepID=A0ABQ0RSD6_9PSEU|nr:MFS transporter [Pseudonocardia saturnea]